MSKNDKPTAEDAERAKPKAGVKQEAIINLVKTNGIRAINIPAALTISQASRILSMVASTAAHKRPIFRTIVMVSIPAVLFLHMSPQQVPVNSTHFITNNRTTSTLAI